jgi:hypothetical protein
MRRFLCTNLACRAVTFAGQADGLTSRCQRRSVPLARLLSQLALELAGRAGARLAAARASLGLLRKRAGSGSGRLLVVPDVEEILFRQQFVQPGLVDPADDDAFLLAVANALGQRER